MSIIDRLNKRIEMERASDDEIMKVFGLTQEEFNANQTEHDPSPCDGFVYDPDHLIEEIEDAVRLENEDSYPDVQGLALHVFSLIGDRHRSDVLRLEWHEDTNEYFIGNPSAVYLRLALCTNLKISVRFLWN